ncbi:MAG: 3-methyl-2-oxobutanoate hydroxymethyltransferase [Candidatus Hadarchaeales archaeon]
MERVTVPLLQEMKMRGEKIVMVAAYDYFTAQMLEEVGVDVILVGDSLASVVLGYPDTLAVTMDEMIHHTRAVARGAKRAMVVGDMPFMSYQASVEDAVKNAGRFLKEGRARAVKVEGGGAMVKKIKGMVDAGIPVMGHIGLTPQWIHQLGGYKVRGKDVESARRIIEDAVKLERAGVFSLVLECMPWQLARAVTKRLRIPTIGIGAGPFCDGQVLVIHDLLGMTGTGLPKFVKPYANLRGEMLKAIERFKGEVKEGKFPDLGHSYEMPGEILKKLKEVRG